MRSSIKNIIVMFLAYISFINAQCCGGCCCGGCGCPSCQGMRPPCCGGCGCGCPSCQGSQQPQQQQPQCQCGCPGCPGGCSCCQGGFPQPPMPQNPSQAPPNNLSPPQAK
ncbi:hypothetical protein EDEG_00655 [Edhazardia aedis USNM 41457]|uniref:Cysteine-rich transmembrane CYSTM domain-containing protein n=1 Tax=Edhazardia aedis (strain USNM 41457) TaxID=1003232 RepID=J9DVI3_EDHAE|nr:hypothetical protein EDEG_00655 [Edhazardia aedis USNM 41457]|eukprot:EJW05297.1 hypothetical protein EDEG_00655 [Edhazardia aedis USNM 41457]